MSDRRFVVAALLLLLASSGLAAESAPAGKPEVPPGFIYVSGGKFEMGCDDLVAKKVTNESPKHEVSLPPFLIARYEVTNRDYRAFIEAKGYEKKEYWGEDGWKWLQAAGRKLPKGWKELEVELGSEFPDHPVTGVSWFEATAFARFAGARLPTEAEWERAARGTDGRKFPWGDSFEAGHRKRPEEEQGGKTYPVGKNPADVSPVGAFDMGGNVSEWTSSWFEPYPGTKYRSRYWGEKAEKHLRIARGGNWYVIDGGPKPAEHKCRTSYRLFEYPHDHGYAFTGFRLAMDVKKADTPPKAPEKDGAKKTE